MSQHASGVSDMGLTCYCGGEYEWFYEGPNDYETLQTKRSRKCCSCGGKIEIGDVVTSFCCYREPRSDYEENRFGDQVPLADKFMCEPCSDLYFSLTELGFCITLGDEMRELAREYAEVYGKRGE